MTGIIDTHFHIWELQRFKYPWPTSDSEQKELFRDFTANDYKDAISSTPVNGSIFVQVLNNSPEEANWILSLAEQHPNIKGLVAGLDLTNPKLSINLAELSKSPRFVGVRHILDFEDPAWICREDVHNGLAVLEKENKTYDLLLRPPLLKHIPAVVAKFPRLKFIVNHMAKPYVKDQIIEGWKAEMEEIAKHPNVYCKISGLIPEADLENWKQEDFVKYVEHILAIFGEDRCMFGSDWPVMHVSSSASFKTVYDLTEELLSTCGVSADGKEKIFGANATNIYNLHD